MSEKTNGKEKTFDFKICFVPYKVFLIRNNLILMNQQKHQFDCNEKNRLGGLFFLSCDKTTS